MMFFHYLNKTVHPSFIKKKKTSYQNFLSDLTVEKEKKKLIIFLTNHIK